MRKNFLVGFILSFVFLCFAGNAKAILTTIGSATYNGTDYNLVWENNNNGNSVVWLDYTNSQGTWYDQMSWVSGLNSTLSLHLDPGYKITWSDDTWRLPSTKDGLFVYGYDGNSTYGYNITTSEMGYLFYEELGNAGALGVDGSLRSGYGLVNTGDFDHLIRGNAYWSGTELSDRPFIAWSFSMDDGSQGAAPKDVIALASGVALHNAQISTQLPTPEPSTLILLSCGMIGIAGIARRKMKK